MARTAARVEPSARASDGGASEIGSSQTGKTTRPLLPPARMATTARKHPTAAARRSTASALSSENSRGNRPELVGYRVSLRRRNYYTTPSSREAGSKGGRASRRSPPRGSRAETNSCRTRGTREPSWLRCSRGLDSRARGSSAHYRANPPKARARLPARLRASDRHSGSHPCGQPGPNPCIPPRDRSARQAHKVPKEASSCPILPGAPRPYPLIRTEVATFWPPLSSYSAVI